MVVTNWNRWWLENIKIVSIDYKIAFSYIDSLKSLFDLKGISTLELEAIEDQLINERINNTKQSSILEYLIK